MYDSKESEGKKRRHQVDTVVEGIGINRVRQITKDSRQWLKIQITHNFSQGLDIIDDAYRYARFRPDLMPYTDGNRISDEEAVAMSRYLVQHDGLYLGSSSACNLVAAVKLAKRLGHECRIATILYVVPSGCLVIGS
jgi:cysteine synthase A